MPGFDGLFDAIFGFTVLTVIASFAIPVIIIIVVVWAIRRSAPAPRDPAEQALRDRLARGDIDQAEFLVRMRALHDGDDRDIT